MSRELPAILTPQLAQRMLAAIETVESQPWPEHSRRAQGPRTGAPASTMVQVLSTAVTNRTQPGYVLTPDPTTGAFTGDSTKVVRVWQADGYVLDPPGSSPRRYRAFPVGSDENGVLVYLTTDQSGIDGTFTICEPLGTKSYLFENGVLKSRT